MSTQERSLLSFSTQELKNPIKITELLEPGTAYTGVRIEEIDPFFAAAAPIVAKRKYPDMKGLADITFFGSRDKNVRLAISTVIKRQEEARGNRGLIRNPIILILGTNQDNYGFKQVISAPELNFVTLVTANVSSGGEVESVSRLLLMEPPSDSKKTSVRIHSRLVSKDDVKVLIASAQPFQHKEDPSGK